MPELHDLLERARRELLDLSTRNRLLSIPVGSKSARVINVVDELTAEVFRLLVRERKSFSFAPGRKRSDASPALEWGDGFTGDPQMDDDDTGLPPPDEEEENGSGPAKRHLDSRLQTTLTPEGLQRRLLDLYRDAQTTIEETGVNVLYLALGQLKWFEAEQADTPRFAPLLLVPVELSRKSASERFNLKAREEDVEENLSLREKLHADFGIELPEFPDADDLDLRSYFAKISKAIVGGKQWEVLPNAMTLGFFSFAKLLMYRDLDPDNWPENRRLLDHPLVSALLGDGFPAVEKPIPDDAHLDELIPAERLDHVVDADGSQSLAIEMVRLGRSLVIQGPPGTGKSQSITNIIATAVLDGKRVLFVAEKLAALEVVKRRLTREGLGDLCLELHSNKASKRAVLEEIGRTWRLGKPRADGLGHIIAELHLQRSKLNGHVRFLHTLNPVTGLTPFRVIGELVRLGERGLAAAQLDLVGAESWDGAARGQRAQLVADLAERISQIGLPAHHVWRGVQRETVLQIDLAPLGGLIRDVAGKVTAVVGAGRALAEALHMQAPANLNESAWLGVLAEHVARAPAVDRQALCAGVWNAGVDQLRDLLSAGDRFLGATLAVGAQVTDSAWEKDLESARSSIAAHGQSWVRLLNGEYRRAIAQLRGVLRRKLPPSYEARVSLTDELVAGQRALRAVREGRELGDSAFGTAWRAEKSDWMQLRQILTWVEGQQAAGLGADFRQMFAAVENAPAVGALSERLRVEIQTMRSTLDRLLAELKLDLASVFNVGELDRIPLAELEARLSVWGKELESLSRWSNFHLRLTQGRELQLGPILEGLYSGVITADQAVAAYWRACFSRILRDMTRANPELARFDGELHEQVLADFRKLDRDRVTLAKCRVLAAHHEGVPNMNTGVGAVGIVNGEMQRQRGHRPIRQLLRDAGSVVQAVKPVFMMSPLSVAQFLAPGAVEFDLLVVDEASQVQPVDALGAISRCHQIVVVGDSKQLPPTRFFARMTTETSNDDEADSGAVVVQDMESILGLCCARGLPQSMLRWHYRSRHHSLIAVSNHEFYENRLFIVPSPCATSTGLGLQFSHVPEGVFDSGGSATNRVEAKAVCRAVFEHARNHPELTLGVAAFSMKQQQAILDELELLRRENPETETFFNSHPAEPFFVKNLENVQGDERDVILISIGYGRDTNGYMAMRFGPLGSDGGERRLNVLISRARKRCVVFSSITADDIDLERAQGRGVRSLKVFLQFAETGRLPLAQRSGREEESPFEEAVRAALEAQGHEIHPQVGVAGFFVDLAVVDRERPGRYVIGIECDGAAYHSSRSARDRDRLRQAVLENHGWVIHRIWSTDWFQRPGEQLRRTLEAIERARSLGSASSGQGASRTASTAPEITRAAESADDLPALGVVAEPYRVVSFAPPRGCEPHELQPRDMADLLFRIVDGEGPIHEDELVARIKELWGFQRAGTRIQDAVAKGIRSLLVTRRCVREEDCLSVPGAAVRIRCRENVSSPGLRKPDCLPSSEIRAAILALIDAGHGASRPELPRAVARLFGFGTTTSTLRERVEQQIAKLIKAKEITQTNGLLQRGSAGTVK